MATLSTVRFKDLSTSDQQNISSYLISVQNCVELDDPDSKKILHSLTKQMDNASVTKKYPPLQELLGRILHYLKDSEDPSSIPRIWEIIPTILQQ